MPLTAVIGTGAWGTAIAALAARDGQPVVLLGRDPAKTTQLAQERRHPSLPGLALPSSLTITADPTSLRQVDLVLWAVPTQATRALARTLAPHLPATAPQVS